MRSLEEIQQAMIAALTIANSPADDLSPGSVLSAIVRSASSVTLEQDNRLQETLDNLDPAKMSGSYLDDYAVAQFNIYRKPGTLARGTVIFSTDANVSLIVPRGTLLTELNRGLQYITVEGPITVTPTLDITVDVLSVAEGAEANLASGTPLYLNATNNPSLLQVKAIVGYERASDGSICGNLSGGTIQETDVALRQRIAEFKDGQGPTLESAISSYLPVNRAWVTTLAPGFVRVYLDLDSPLTDEFQDQLRQRVLPFLPLGVAVSFERASLRPIEIAVRVEAYSDTTPDLDIRQALEMHFSSFEPGQVVHPEALRSLISSYVSSVQMDKPSRPIQLRPDQLPQLSDISICYD
jgi:hypothetical protein